MMNKKLVLVMPIIAIFLSSSVLVHALAMSYDYRYAAGYQFGYQEGQNAKQSGDPYNPGVCPYHHSWQYCQGFHDGYNDAGAVFSFRFPFIRNG
jgi:hypothetical protein